MDFGRMRPLTRVLPRPDERVVVFARDAAAAVQEYKTILDRSHRRNQDGTAGRVVTAAATPSRWE